MKYYFKILTAIFFIVTCTNLIVYQKNISTNLAIATKDNKQLKIISGSEVTETIHNDEELNSNQQTINSKKNPLFNINDKINLNLIDKANPNNIEKVNTKFYDDNMIINFEKPEDKGTNYDYVIKNNSNEKEIKYYANSGIKGYSYSINESINDEAPPEINKLDNSAIVEQNIDWTKDYYLHIKTFDNAGNQSDNQTIKLDLPSNGVTIKYIDINSNDEIDTQEEITGVAKQEYDASNYRKDIEDFVLIKTQGDLQGTLKREKINILYKYAKKANLIVKYIDENTGDTISKATIINGYIGKEYYTEPKIVEGYQITEKPVESEGYLYAENQEIIYYYTKREEENNEAEKEENLTNNENENEEEINNSQEEKNEEENLNKSKNEEQIEVKEESDKKEKSNAKNKIIKITYKEYETGEILKTEEIIINDEKEKYKIKIPKEYKIVSIEDSDNNNIIDEIINSLKKDEDFVENNESNIESKEDKKQNQNVITEYEIVLNCDDSDYIIYYKK